MSGMSHHVGNFGGLEEIIPQLNHFIKKLTEEDVVLAGNLMTISACLLPKQSMLSTAATFVRARLNGEDQAICLMMISKTAAELGAHEIAKEAAEGIPVCTFRDLYLEAISWSCRYNPLAETRMEMNRLAQLEGKEGITDYQIVTRKCVRAFDSKLCTMHCSKLLKNLRERYEKSQRRTHTRAFLNQRISAYISRIRAMVMFRT